MEWYLCPWRERVKVAEQLRLRSWETDSDPANYKAVLGVGVGARGGAVLKLRTKNRENFLQIEVGCREGFIKRLN